MIDCPMGQYGRPNLGIRFGPGIWRYLSAFVSWPGFAMLPSFLQDGSEEMGLASHFSPSLTMLDHGTISSAPGMSDKPFDRLSGLMTP